MQPIDFSCLLDASLALASLPAGAKLNLLAYELNHRLQLRGESRDQDLLQEFVRTADDVLLIAGDWPRGALTHSSSDRGSVLAHIQFPRSGRGRKWATDGNVIETPEHSCIRHSLPQQNHHRTKLGVRKSLGAQCVC
jgi:hypothetical protein